MLSGRQRPEAGFTLLEMIFVMVIVGLLTSLMAPRIGANLEHYEALSQRKDLEDQFRQLPRRVRYIGRSIELPGDLVRKDIGDGRPAIEMPPGWLLKFTPDLVISSNGACSSSVLELAAAEDSSVVAQYNVAEISCEITPVAE